MFRKAAKGLGVAAFGAGSYKLGLHVAEADAQRAIAQKEASKNGPVTVFAFAPSAPCQKVLAYLEYHNVPHTAVEVSPLTKKELLFSPTYKKVPIAFVKGAQVDDSSEILKQLAAAGYGGKHDEAAMRYLDEEVYPALVAATWTDGGKAWEKHGVFWHGALRASLPLMKYKYQGVFGDKLDAGRLESVLAEAFKKAKGGVFSGTTTTEVALYGLLRTAYEVDAVRDAVGKVGKADWYAAMEKQTKENSEKLRAKAEEKPKSKCPFAGKH